MNQHIVEALSYIARTRKLTIEEVVKIFKETTEYVLQRKFGEDTQINVKIDPKKGLIEILIEKRVVERVTDPDKEISLEDAKKLDPTINVGEKILDVLPLEHLGRGVIAKIQELFSERIKESEKLRIYKDLSTRVGELLRAKVWRVDKTGVYLQIGADGVIPPEEQIPGEKYKVGKDVLALILKVEDINESESKKRKPRVVLSRTHKDFLRRLLEQEIPEIADGTVEIKDVERIPGKRAKVAVRSKDPKVDPIGACIGIRGTRIKPVVQELGGENIDIVLWSNDPTKYAANALSPITPVMVYLEDQKIVVVVKDEEIAEAKGKDGSNVILASRLVKHEITIIPLSEYSPPKDKVLTYELDLSDEMKDRLLKAGYFYFEELPSLAELIEKVGVDEKKGVMILRKIEEELLRKAGEKFEG